MILKILKQLPKCCNSLDKDRAWSTRATSTFSRKITKKLCDWPSSTRRIGYPSKFGTTSWEIRMMAHIVMVLLTKITTPNTRSMKKTSSNTWEIASSDNRRITKNLTRWAHKTALAPKEIAIDHLTVRAAAHLALFLKDASRHRPFSYPSPESRRLKNMTSLIIRETREGLCPIYKKKSKRKN